MYNEIKTKMEEQELAPIMPVSPDAYACRQNARIAQRGAHIFRWELVERPRLAAEHVRHENTEPRLLCQWVYEATRIYDLQDTVTILTDTFWESEEREEREQVFIRQNRECRKWRWRNAYRRRSRTLRKSLRSARRPSGSRPERLAA